MFFILCLEWEGLVWLLQFRLLISKINNDKNLEETLNLRNLRIVDVPSDDSCFFYAISYELPGCVSSQKLVPQVALDQVLWNPELYKELQRQEIGIDIYQTHWHICIVTFRR